MPLKKPLEQPIINAIIRYAYALRKDEEAALLSAFLVISYRIHREAVQCMMPGISYEQIMAAHMPATSAEEAFIDAVSEISPREPLIIRHLHNVAATTAALPELIRSNVIAPVQAAITGSVNAAVVRLRESTLFMTRRRREALLQEEEEIALFSTIQGVANQVNREAIEGEIREGIAGGLAFAAAYERPRGEPRKTVSMPVKEVVVTIEKRSAPAKPRRWPRDSYIALMDEELTIPRGLIDRNRAMSQRCLNTMG
jgi:hypothetical protein